MERLRGIILDFDGTLVESVGIKDEAFKSLFAAYPDSLDEIMSYHLSHNATIRFEKFRHIYKNILRLPYSKEIEENLGRRFSDITLSKIVACPFVAGALDFLNYFSGHLPLFLASISPPADLDRILEVRHLRMYFKRIYAHPWRKTEVIRDVLSREHVSTSELIFIGDSPEDLEAAQETRIAFVGRQSGKMNDRHGVPIFDDFSCIREYVEKFSG